jgi:hypothetical protein
MTKKAGIPQVFGTRGELHPMSQATRDHLKSHFAEDRRELEGLLQRAIPVWD